MSRFDDKAAPPSPPTYNCLNCKHSGAVQGGNVCRLRPPTPLMMMQQGLQGPTPATVAMWPPITNYDWCGEHQPKLQG